MSEGVSEGSVRSHQCALCSPLSAPAAPVWLLVPSSHLSLDRTDLPSSDSQEPLRIPQDFVVNPQLRELRNPLL